MTLPIQLPDFPGRAACAETDPEAWFPEMGGSARAAKAVCGGCEIVEQCLLWALANGEMFGVWGGLTVKERKRLERVRGPRPISHGTRSGYVIHRKRGEKPCESCRVASVTANREYQAAAARKAGAA